VSRKILISIVNKDSLTFEVNEDAKKGDYFSLNNLNKINLSSLEKSLKNEKDKIISSHIEKNRDYIFSKMKIEDLEFKKILKNLDEIKEKNIELKGEIKLKEQGINEANKRIETEKQLATSTIKEELSKQINTLKSDLKLKEQDINEANKRIETEKQLATSTIKEELSKQINTLKSDLKLKEQEVSEANRRIETEKKLVASTIKEELSKKINTLKSDLKLKEQEVNEANKRIETEKQLATSIVKEELSKKINTLKSDIKLKEQDINEANKRIETEKQLATSTIKEELSKQVNYLENELKLKTQAVDNINNKINLELKLAVADETNKLKNDIRILESRRDKMSIKDIGEDLENFMKTEFSNNFGSSHAKFEKINISTDGKKPDFKFSIFDTDQSIISSIILEAKSEALNSKTKTKNHNHLEKLDLDRKKHNGEYAILVSELEKNEDRFIFKKVTDYEQMFIVRPQYFIALLYLIYNLEIKKRGVQDLEITFQEKQEILHEFNSMKENIIDETIPLITNKINNIISKAEKIEAISQEIIADGNTALGSRNIATLIRKIENFKIKKLLKRIDSLQ